MDRKILMGIFFKEVDKVFFSDTVDKRFSSNRFILMKKLWEKSSYKNLMPYKEFYDFFLENYDRKVYTVRFAEDPDTAVVQMPRKEFIGTIETAEEL